MKQCRRCKVVKDESEFVRRKRNKDGLSCWCKQCNSEYKRQYNGTERGKEIRRISRSNYRAKHREEIKDKFLRRKYGLTTKQRTAMYSEQNGRCGICKRPISYDRIVTDHDHKTGRIRGLLCRKCNFFVGLIECSEDTLYSAFEWIGWAK